MTRIAVLDEEKCNPEKCNLQCINFCPVNRQGEECIYLTEDKSKVEINEELCTGCGICVKKCPFNAISIVNKPEEAGEPIHRFGMNAFRVYGLPKPGKGVTGLVGANGVGKSTLIKILSGHLTPNLGKYNEETDWNLVIDKYRGREISSYLENISEGEVKTSYKPQVVSKIPKAHSGKVSELLEKTNEKGDKLQYYKDKLSLDKCWDRELSDISGGELQRTAIAACLVKDADVYFIDEPTSYLDIKQRLKVAELIRELGEEKRVMVVEHDLAILDYLTDYVNILYGKPGVYGMVSSLKSSRKGINQFLNGFLEKENVRIRDYEIKFEEKPPSTHYKGEESIEYPEFEKNYSEFDLKAEAGEIKKAEVVGIIGENAIGKSTFVKILAGEEDADNVDVDLDAEVSYKPQYVSLPEKDITVEQYIATADNIDRKTYKSRIEKMIEDLYQKKLSSLSGGEKQRVAIALALSKKADLCLLDEPSAFLDIEQRFKVSKAIRRATEDRDIATLVVDHDLLFQDMVSNRLMRFTGTPGEHGEAKEPVEMKKGMSNFLEKMDITMRREPRTGRPRINKKDSQKDREQKKKDEYYYTVG